MVEKLIQSSKRCYSVKVSRFIVDIHDTAYPSFSRKIPEHLEFAVFPELFQTFPDIRNKKGL